MANFTVPSGYVNKGGVEPDWLNKGDNGWQLAAATLVGIQSMPGLVILYGSIVKKKWAVNSAFMALYAFAATWLCWVVWGYQMSFGEQLLPIWGKAGSALSYKFLLSQAVLPSTAHYYKNGTLETAATDGQFGMADMVIFQFFFAALTLIMLAGAVLGRMSFRAWMMFVPLWLTFSYTVGAFSMWGGGFLWQWGVIDYAGGYVIHVSSGVAGFVAAYWVCTLPIPPHTNLKGVLCLLKVSGHVHCTSQTLNDLCRIHTQNTFNMYLLCSGYNRTL
jgi:Amt family ammonium transporter